MNKLGKILEKVIKASKKSREWRSFVYFLAAVVVFTTTYALILPAITVEKSKTDSVGGLVVEEADQGSMGAGAEASGDVHTAKAQNEAVLVAAAEEVREPYNGEVQTIGDRRVMFLRGEEFDVVVSSDLFSGVSDGTTLSVRGIPDANVVKAYSDRISDELLKIFVDTKSTEILYRLVFTDENYFEYTPAGYFDVEFIFHNNTVGSDGEMIYSPRFDGKMVYAAVYDYLTDEMILAEKNGDQYETPVISLDKDGFITGITLKGLNFYEFSDIITLVGGPENEELKLAAERTESTPEESPEEAESTSEEFSEETESTPEETTEGTESRTEETTEGTESRTEETTERTESRTEETTEKTESKTEGSTEKEKTPEESKEAKGSILRARGSDYTVTLTYSEKAEIPDKAVLEVKEVGTGTDAYIEYLEQAKAAAGLDKDLVLPKNQARFFEMRIMADGKEVVPAANVNISIKYDAPVVEPDSFAGSHLDTYAVCFGKKEAQAVEVTRADAGSVEFEAESLSVCGVIHTVNFYRELDGKIYEFSMPGGGFVSLEHLVEVLGINKPAADAGDDSDSAVSSGDFREAIDLNNMEVGEAAKQLVADVANVEFSSPDLVWVGKADETTTVGSLKEENRLKVEYAAELTKEQTAEIDAETVGAGDWALIGIEPFRSEETLTVTMKSGEQFTVKVTDSQIKKTTISAAGDTWEVTVTYDESAGIPDGAKLKVTEIQPKDRKYQKYYDESAETAGVAAAEDTVPEAENDTDGAVAEKASEDTAAKRSNPAEEHEAFSDLEYARIFNIEIWSGNKKIEPKSEVAVNIKLKDAPEDTAASPKVVHFAGDGPELMEISEKAENTEEEGIRFTTDSFSVYSVLYTVDFFFEVSGKEYSFSMQGADSVSLRALVEALHIYEAKTSDEHEKSAAQGESGVNPSVTSEDVAGASDAQNQALDRFMSYVQTVTFSNEELLVPAKVKKDTTVGKIKTELELYPTYPLGLKQSEVVALNQKEYKAGDWALISMKAFDTPETLTVTMKNGDTFTVRVTDAQDAVMIGDVVQTIPNPAGTTIDLFDYWIVSQDLVGRDGWGDLNQSIGAREAGDDRPLNGSGNNQGINSSPTDSAHGHALKFNPAWAGTVYNGNKIGTTGNAWQSVNMDRRDGLNSYTGDEETWHWNCPLPFTGIVENYLSNGYPILTDNQDIGTTGESLAYLFDPTVGHDGKASYSGVNHLLYIDRNGYYTYDSRDYAAAFDAGSGTFTLTEQTSTNSEIRGFWPFGIQNFWSGMHVNTQFSMPSGGYVLNPSGELMPMEFEFSGDDDVWIYVDGILIGDAGGIHNRTEVDIDFSTGEVNISGQPVKYLDQLYRQGMADEGRSPADIEQFMSENFDGHVFKEGTYHSFDFFYLERGGGESNLYIHYNLVSTADFTGHKSYFGADTNDILARDQFKFELIGLDGKYRSVLNSSTGQYELVREDDTTKAIMPNGGTPQGDGTVASPYYNNSTTTALSDGTTVNSQTFKTGVSEDGNINFGSAVISQIDMNEADQGNPPVYRYVIREIVPDDARNGAGITWAAATEEQRAAGGFVKDQVTYDGTVYYMTGRVTSWTETNANGQQIVRHGINKTYYTDDTYTTVKDNVGFVNFENRFTPDFGDVEFKKVDGTGSPLAGAEFALYTDAQCTVPALDLDTDGHPAWTAASNADGIVSFENVRVGTYYMKETSAPSPYVLDETIYKVVIEDSKDTSRHSKITINGDATETEVTEIANAQSGKITLIKKWLDAFGQETSGGSNSVTVQLKRKRMVADGAEIASHTVTVAQSVMNYRDGGQQMFGTPTVQNISADTVTIEWDDEWQDNFNWTLQVGSDTYEGHIGNGNTVTGSCYTFEKINVDGRSRRLTVTNITGDVTLSTKYHVDWLYNDGGHWANLNSPVITAPTVEPNYVAEDDVSFNNAGHTQPLNSSNSWTKIWNIGGSESSHSGFDFPAMDDDGRNYLYYVVELDAQGQPIVPGGSPLEGYILRGYSANNNTGISNQGTITVYNQAERPSTIDIIIKKRDAVNNTLYLDGAVFKLEYRADESGTFTNVSKSVVPELSTDSQFTVPTAGVTLTGLVDGQYRIQEILPPDGYLITETYPVQFTVSGGIILNTQGTMTGVEYSPATATTDAEFIIPNTSGATLPDAGGPGANLFYMIGCILTMLAGAGIVMKRRRSGSE